MPVPPKRQQRRPRQTRRATMTTPPAAGPGSSEPDPRRWSSPPPAEPVSEPVSFDKPEAPFDPYRYGAPEHPVPPEYAPLGYSTCRHLSQRSCAVILTVAAWHRPPRLGLQLPGAAALRPAVPAAAHWQRQGIAALPVLGILAIVFCWTSIFDVLLVAPAVIFAPGLGLPAARCWRRPGHGDQWSGVGALVAAMLAVVLTDDHPRLRVCVDSNKSCGTSAYNKLHPQPPLTTDQEESAGSGETANPAAPPRAWCR